MSSENEGRAAAERFRSEHHLGTQPLGDLVAIIEQSTGIDVAVLDAGPDEHGLTMRDPQRGAIFIGVARTTRPMRQRSTLAHELGHVLFEDWTQNDDTTLGERTPVEIRADAFARHLLIPLPGLQEFVGQPETITEGTLSAVVQRFLVSPAIASIALHQADYIDTDTKKEWLKLTAPVLAARFGWIDQYRALQDESNHRRAPQRLLARAIRGYVEGVLPVEAIATLRGMPAQDVQQELAEAGIEPHTRSVAWAPV